jgi:hypothetical protein
MSCEADYLSLQDQILLRCLSPTDVVRLVDAEERY